MAAQFMADQIMKAPLQALGQMQQSHLFQIFIPYIPMQGPSPEITLLARSTAIPKTTRAVDTIRVIGGREFTVPQKKSKPHSWSLTFLFAENDTLYRRLTAWFEMTAITDVKFLKTIAVIDLVSSNMIPTKLFTLSGLYPTDIPGIETLSYDKEEFLKLTCNFSFDDIFYI